MNKNWNQADPDLYTGTQKNFLARGLIPTACKPDLYQFCNSSPKTWTQFRNTSVTELFGNGTVSVQKFFGCNTHAYM